ncbi:MAG: GAF domain-containing sensor histidine kinase [Armatimonadota bacterium]
MPAEAQQYTPRREELAMERTLADVRIILWLATAVIMTTLWVQNGNYRFWLPLGLFIFLVYSAGMWLIVHYFPNPRLLHTAIIVSSFIEVLLITFIVWATYAPMTPYYLWYVFYVVSIALRYGLQFSIISLSASVILYTISAMSPDNSIVNVPNFLGYTWFLFILAFLFGHMSERQRSYQVRLTVVNELGVALSSLTTSKGIIKHLVSETARLVGSKKCWFIPYQSTEGGDISSASVGISNDEISTLVGSLGDWSPDKVLERGRILVSNNCHRDHLLPADVYKLIPMKSLAVIPLYVRELPVGVLYAADRQTRRFSGYDIELLELVAAQAAPIIENIKLWEQLKETAASEERLRIARDLHDDFLQTLSAIKLYLERCRLLIDKDPEKAKSSVDRLNQITTQGLADVRSYLSQLRLMGPEPSKFSEAAEKAAAEAASRGGFIIHTDVDVSESVLTPQLSLTAFQILRELLNNVVKHAEAENVWFKVISDLSILSIEVRDDGTGFDLDEGKRASEKGHLGLVGIEERVKEHNGEICMESKPGDGTRMRVFLTIPPDEQATDSE